MKPMTEQNLRDAFAGESQAAMKYNIFSDVAEKEGFPNIAKLFRGISYAERVHTTNHLKALGDIGTTKQNLETAFNGEDFEIESMYPAYKVVAELEEEKKALKSIEWAMVAEKDHRTMYDNAKKSMESGKDIDSKNVYVCEICGHTHYGDSAPEKCPICGAGSNKYKAF